MECLEPIDEPRCERCGKPFIYEGGESHICGECRLKKRHFDFAFSPYAYTGPAAAVVWSLKYNRNLSSASTIARLIRDRVLNEKIDLAPFRIIAPIPLHYSRMASRGFNQSALIALELANLLGLTYVPDLLQRVRATPTQVSLPRNLREENVKNAFAVAFPKKADGKSIIIVDDVYTTGATINEASRILKKAGADKILALTAARALLEYE
ncbi:MAG: ComF family protein [Myxococcota bacterium]